MQPNDSVFSDVAARFLDRAGDRRHYRRRPGTFALWWERPSPGEAAKLEGIGTEISASGIVFVSEEEVVPSEFDLLFSLDDRHVRARVRQVRDDRIVLNGRPCYRCACEFSGIPADDWDAIERYVNAGEIADSPVQRREESRQTNEAFALLPPAIQQGILNALLAKGRLEPPDGDRTPVLRVFYGGVELRPGQKPRHWIHIHSRVQAGGERIAYDTRFLVTDDGAVEAV